MFGKKMYYGIKYSVVTRFFLHNLCRTQKLHNYVGSIFWLLYAIK